MVNTRSGLIKDCPSTSKDKMDIEDRSDNRIPEDITVKSISNKSNRSKKSIRNLRIAKAKEELAAARLAVIEAEYTDDEEEESNSKQSEIDVTTRTKNWVTNIEENIDKKNDEFQKLTNAIILAINSGQHRTSHKIYELPIFTGMHQEWLMFKTAYDQSAKSYTNIENIARLRHCLRGRARETIESLLFTSNNPSEIVQSLETRFGRPDFIARSELERLRNIQNPTNSPRDICIFSSKVSNIVTTLKALNKIQYLYNPEVTKVVADKLPMAIRYKWFEYSALQTEDEPDLVKLTKFLEIEASYCGPHAEPEKIEKFVERRPQRTFVMKENTNKFKCALCDSYKHITSKCEKYKNSNVKTRWDIAKQHKLCFKCLKYRNINHMCKSIKCNINNCPRTHNRLLHFDKPRQEEKTEIVGTTWSQRKTKSFLKIIPVKISGPTGEIETHALLDDGSTITLLDNEIACEIGAKGPINPLKIEAISDALQLSNSRRVSIYLQGSKNKYKIEARTIDNLQLSPQMIQEEDITNCKHLEDIKHKLIYTNSKPKLLIGQDNWHLLLANETRKGQRDQPVASLTKLGWVLHGSCNRTLGERIHFTHYTDASDDKLEELMKQYFSLESLIINPKLPKNDINYQALELLKKNTKEIEGNQYQTGLLWKKENIELPNNYECAMKRLINTENKIDKNPILKEKYNSQMASLLEKGYAELAPSQKTKNRTWYLPHFPVINPAKPDKIRIVHDAAAKTKGVSLNDHLLTGPDLLKSLPGVLMRFRRHKIAVSADIAEMFMQVKIQIKDRDALRYLWRGNRRQGDPDEYRMTSLIFGATSSPSSAIYVKDLNASKYIKEYPVAVKAITENHYMDDYLDSFQTIEEAKKISKEVYEIHKKGHFNLTKWISNSIEVKKQFDNNIQQSSELFDNKEYTERILGLIWNPNTDELAFNLNLSKIPQKIIDNETPTKREMLKIVMSLFDPLGLVSPITIQAKKIIQEVWRRGIKWDQKIEMSLAKSWKEWMIQLKNIKYITIPRCYLYYSDTNLLQLHIFVDASETAYVATLYWRVVTPSKNVYISLIVAKARVAPLKLTSIPRLELQAAVMGSRMATTVIEEHQIKPESKFFWTDSKTVLTWIKTGSRSYKPFVAHRVAAIEENSTVNEWRWIPTKLNVADDATRNIPKLFDKNHRWFHGPEFLYQDQELWPIEKDLYQEKTGEERTHYIIQEKIYLKYSLPEPNRFSRWERLLRSTARVLQFIHLCKNKIYRIHYKRTQRNTESDTDWRQNNKKVIKKITTSISKRDKYLIIDTEILQKAEILLISLSQQDSFIEEINDLKDNKPVSSKSRLHALSVQIIDNVIVLKTRIGIASEINANLKTPPILDGNHHITKLWIEYIHKQLHHAGVETTINECRQQYWILRLRPITKMIIHRCFLCQIRKNVPSTPATGNHPVSRLAHHQRPFSYTGLDYFGPVTITIGRSLQKRFVALFTCLTTRAVHLEVVTTMSTNSAIMALRRMIARRGCPTEIWSDNGTNFRGADKELRLEINRAVEQEASKKMITWRFIPPSAPFMGGAWERLVRSVKVALYAAIHERYPTEEVFVTLLSEVEYTVNSRPLTHVSVSAEDPEALTPNHFLLNGSVRIPVFGSFDEEKQINRSHWKTSQQLANMFWSRWIREYLPELQYRRDPHNKGPILKLGDIVLIVDNTLPRNTWPKGKVIAIFPGIDGIVRTADVQTKGGVLRRPTKKLIILNIE